MEVNFFSWYKYVFLVQNFILLVKKCNGDVNLIERTPLLWGKYRLNPREGASPASEHRDNTWNVSQDFNLKAKARIWR